MLVLMEKNRFLHPAESCYTRGWTQAEFYQAEQVLERGHLTPAGT